MRRNSHATRTFEKPGYPLITTYINIFTTRCKATTTITSLYSHYHIECHIVLVLLFLGCFWFLLIVYYFTPCVCGVFVVFLRDYIANFQAFLECLFCAAKHTHTHCSSMNVDQTDSAPPPYKHHCVQHIPSQYEVNFLDKIIVCQVPDCPVWTTNNTNIIRNHLCIRHPLDEFKFVAVKLKRCQQCGLYMTRKTDGHINSAFCKKYSVRTQNAKRCNRLNRIMMDTTPFLI
jgi:hypothetical protein